MNMMAGPPLFKRAIVQMGEARATLHPALSQDLEGATVTDRRCKLACIGVCVLPCICIAVLILPALRKMYVLGMDLCFGSIFYSDQDNNKSAHVWLACPAVTSRKTSLGNFYGQCQIHPIVLCHPFDVTRKHTFQSHQVL